MKWTESYKRKPKSPGLYGTMLRGVDNDPFDFYIAYFDGAGWYLPTQTDPIENYPVRRDPVKWCKLEIGVDE